MSSLVALSAVKGLTFEAFDIHLGCCGGRIINAHPFSLRTAGFERRSFGR